MLYIQVWLGQLRAICMVCKNSVCTFQGFQNGTNRTMIRQPTLKFPNTNWTTIGRPTENLNFWLDRFLYLLGVLREWWQLIQCIIRQNGSHIYSVCSFRMVKMGPIGQWSDIWLGAKIFVQTGFCIQSETQANCCNQYTVSFGRMAQIYTVYVHFRVSEW
jgi:hypothetical protein